MREIFCKFGVNFLSEKPLKKIMGSEILRSHGEKRDFSIVLVYLLLTQTVTDVKFTKLIQPLAVDYSEQMQIAGEVDSEGENLSTEGIMRWLTSGVFRSTESNSFLAYFLQGSNNANNRGDFDLSLLNSERVLPHQIAVEPRATETENDFEMLEQALRDIEGVTPSDVQEDFATGMSLTATFNQTEIVAVPQPSAYAQFNSFDQFVSHLNVQQDTPMVTGLTDTSKECVCVNGKLMLLQGSGDDYWPDWVVRKGELSSCAADATCNTNNTNDLQLQDSLYANLLTEFDYNAVEYEELKRFAYNEQQAALANANGNLGVNAVQQDCPEELKREGQCQVDILRWLEEPVPQPVNDPIYAEPHEQQGTFWTELSDSNQQIQRESNPTFNGRLTSDEESGVHSDGSAYEYDMEQNASGAFDQPAGDLNDSPSTSHSQSNLLGQKVKHGELDDEEEVDDCEFYEEENEQEAYTVPKAGSRRPQKRQASDAFSDSSYNDDLMSQSASLGLLTINLPFSEHEIVHSTWPRFEAMLRDRRLTASDIQTIKDVRRRGKNKIAAMNCRRRKQNRVETLRDERLDLQQENEELESSLLRLREQERALDERLERALHALRDPTASRH